jgi:hypothetical protein
VAIYRPTPRRWPLAVAAALVGAGLGFALGWGLRGAGGPDLAAAAERLRSALSGAAGTLEVVEVEYRESVQDGEVVRPPEYRGARDALARSRQRYLEAREGLRVLDPEAAERADRLFADLQRLVEGRAPAEEVSTAVRELVSLLRAVPGAAAG